MSMRATRTNGGRLTNKNELQMNSLVKTKIAVELTVCINI